MTSTVSRSDHPGVSHWVDGRHTWNIGVSGFWIRFRGMVTSVLLPLPLCGTPFWWPALNGHKLLFCIVAGVVLILLLLISLYVRFRTIRSLHIKADLRLQIHTSRDELCEALETIDLSLTRGNITREEIKNIEAYANKSCETIARYYSTLCNDRSIGCAIRLMLPNQSPLEDNACYETVGRGGILNPSRKNTSKPLKRSEGIAAFFLSEEIGRKGVLMFDDIGKAISNGCILPDKNMKSFKEEIKTMTVVPINGWYGKEIDLIGLLYITSQTKKIINPHHTDLFKFSADCLSTTFSAIFASLVTKGSLPKVLPLTLE